MSGFFRPGPRPHRRRNIAVLLAAIALAGFIWWAFIITPWAADQTRSPEQHVIWRGTLPGLDVGLDAYPPRVQAKGYVEGWVSPPWTDEIWVLLRIPGAPARPVPPEWVTV
jgi:hypothetical protein